MRERDEQTSQAGSLQELAKTLELQLKDRNDQVSASLEDAAQQKATATQMRSGKTTRILVQCTPFNFTLVCGIRMVQTVDSTTVV